MSRTPEQYHKARLRAETRFRWYGRAALGFAVACLIVLLLSIASRGVPGFMRAEMRLAVPIDATTLGMAEGQTVDDMSPARFSGMLRAALAAKFPAATENEQNDLFRLMGSDGGLIIKKQLQSGQAKFGDTVTFWFPASDKVDKYIRGIDSADLTDGQRMALDGFNKDNDLRRRFDWGFFTRGDSRSPVNAGFLGAMAGSFFTVIVCLLAAFPIGVMSAVYLQEFAHKTRFSAFIEVNVNNIAAVPSIVYGLLGLSVYINFMHMPRSAPVVGGLTLALMAFPVIIIATRTALASVPPSIKQGALALGASPVQVCWHHTLPLSLPGIMTGTILGMARALGETAPLLMIGMVAFVADIPTSFTSAATVMPVQIYLWASSPEIGFVEKTASGILVLLVLLLAMNATAIYLRKKFEVKW